MNTTFWQTNVGKAVKVALYSGVSAILGALISATTNDPALFGPATVIINTALVLIKTSFDATTVNLGDWLKTKGAK